MPIWLLDSLEEDSAQIEEDGVRVVHTPRSILPENAKEGDVLIVEREDLPAGKHDAVRVTIRIDRAATRAAKLKSRQQVRRVSEASKKRDPGGDIGL